MKVRLGVDCGSIGIKVILLNEASDVIYAKYYRNQGIANTLKLAISELDTSLEIIGVGVTGSGRSFANIILGADLVESEILSHAIATITYHPDVATILDIGGEDSKIMKVRNGIVEDFRMNQICGAGTGSVLDAIAARLGVEITDIGDVAMQSNNTITFPGKCGIFTQSSVVSRINSGALKEDILNGVIKALVSNFLMLGKGINLRPPYVFQGALTANKAVVHALSEQLGEIIIIPTYAPFMGAIGVAIMTNTEKTRFRGFDFNECTTRIVQAKGCENKCEITMLYEDHRAIGCFGNRCDKCAPRRIESGR